MTAVRTGKICKMSCQPDSAEISPIWYAINAATQVEEDNDRQNVMNKVSIYLVLQILNEMK